MSGPTNEEIVREYARASVEFDLDTLARLRHPKWSVVWPQSGERVMSNESFAEMSMLCDRARSWPPYCYLCPASKGTSQPPPFAPRAAPPRPGAFFCPRKALVRRGTRTLSHIRAVRMTPQAGETTSASVALDANPRG